MTPLATIPPTVSLLMNEDWGSTAAPDQFLRRYQKMANEIADQAEWTYENFDYFDNNETRNNSFVITASGGLNPFSEHDICSEPICRAHAARQIVRTVGLYADCIVVPDVLSYQLMDLRKPKIHDALWILTQALVLRELSPLIEAGVIRFWSGRVAMCSGCSQHVEAEVDEAAGELIEEFGPYIKGEISGSNIAIHTTGPIEHPLVLHHPITETHKELLNKGTTVHSLAVDLMQEVFRRRLRSTLFELNQSQQTSSTLFSTSRSELHALRKIDDEAPSLSKLAVWEKARSIQLPWVSELSSQEIVDLRDAASRALPAFRESFVRHITNPGADVRSVSDRIEELRVEACDVERELNALNIAKERNFRNLSGALGVTASVYGFAAGVAAPPVALGGLMSLLGLIHSSARHDERFEDRMTSKPGFVLFKAKVLAEHAPQGRK